MKKSLIALLLLSGCASQGIDRDDQGHIIKHYYATVESIEKVKLSSEVGSGIMVGAGVGLAEDLDGNTEDMISGAIAGALVGGLFTALFEGGNTAYQYTLNDAENGEFIVIQKKKLPNSTRCVRVKTGNKVKLEAANNSFCINNKSTES
ncbi:hypothetical protein [Pseudoalteromonas sp. 10-33]|uniref:hypothetical protein n=1 Tax=Pseudoalteromonas sp. 10-33 TaxID=1761890 RepID=UPI0007322770|nr:hypothetical protein [Pseudoalteromonas sp. 10-33]KTF08586.1 hypothetical protein ATS76_13255 [Pseudoalteromonas sp. 10-33]